MSHHSWRLQLILAGLLMGITLPCGLLAISPTTAVAPAQGDRLPPPARVARRTNLPVVYSGMTACGQGAGGCHENPMARSEDLLCRCNELTLWKTHDKHHDAYRVLELPLGQRMLKALGYASARSAKECLSCHAAVIEPDARANATFSLEEGVTCVVCHGPHTRWIRWHASLIDREDFRKLSGEEKEKQFGLTDLWNPVKRARLCASCHIGNQAEGKFVTHAMFAAGHPPLPGFELATFGQQMPPHWVPLSAKSPAAQSILGYKAGEQEQTRLLLIGAAVSLAESMRLLEQQALLVGESSTRALDLANFDCWSCHHELGTPTWRPGRGIPGRPGRVPPKTWPVELVRLGVAHLTGDRDNAQERARLDELFRTVSLAFTAQPLGDPKRIAPAAAALAAWADDLARQLDAKPIDAAQVRRLLALLPALYQPAPGRFPGLLDYDSARQVGWAYSELFREVGNGPFPTGWHPLEDYLQLRLPAGRMKPGASDGRIEQELDVSLKRIHGYDPAKFGMLFRDMFAPNR